MKLMISNDSYVSVLESIPTFTIYMNPLTNAWHAAPVRVLPLNPMFCNTSEMRDIIGFRKNRKELLELLNMSGVIDVSQSR